MRLSSWWAPVGVAAAALSFLSPTSSWAVSDPAELVIGTDDLFGFTLGSDIGDAGARTLGLESTWGLGKRVGRYRAGETTLDARYNVTDDFQLGVAASATSFFIRNVPGLIDRDFTSFGGITPAVRWRLLERRFSPGHPTAAGSPVGVTLTLAPTFGFFDEATGERAGRTGLEARLSVDAALIPSRLFGAANFFYEAERVQPRRFLTYNSSGEQVEPADPEVVALARAPTERSSTLGLSAALSYQIVSDYFVGAEARYRRAYEGLGLRSLAGQALFVGPTFFANLGNERTLSLAWSTQVAGRAEGVSGNLDLTNFSRHEAKLSFRLGF